MSGSGHLNINSIRNKFECLSYIIEKFFDIFLISETKLNDTFYESQFLLDGFHPPNRKDGTDKGGGLLLYVCEYIPCREIIVEFLPIIEAIVIEINLKKKKWLLLCSYNPHKSMINNHFKSISLQFDTLHKTYENFILIGDFNSETCEGSMKDFCCLYNLKNLVKNPTCFKNSEHPTCIDLILTNKSSSLQHTSIIETGLSDFHRLTVTVMKINFQKQAKKILYYRNYNRFNNELFRIDLIQELSTQGFHNVQCLMILKI